MRPRITVAAVVGYGLLSIIFGGFFFFFPPIVHAEVISKATPYCPPFPNSDWVLQPVKKVSMSGSYPGELYYACIYAKQTQPNRGSFANVALYWVESGDPTKGGSYKCPSGDGQFIVISPTRWVRTQLGGTVPEILSDLQAVAKELLAQAEPFAIPIPCGVKTAPPSATSATPPATTPASPAQKETETVYSPEELEAFASFDREFEPMGLGCLPAGETDKPVAKITEYSGTIWVNQGNGWKRVGENYELRPGEKIRVDKNSLLRMEFYDGGVRQSDGSLSEPTVVDVLQETGYCIHDVKLVNEKIPQRTGVIEVARGVLRLLTRGWKSGSIFSVKAGTTFCGSRGTDMLVEYDPIENHVTMNLKEGTGTVTNGKNEISVKPGERVEVIKNAIQPVSPLDQVAYAAFLTKVGDDLDKDTGGGKYGKTQYFLYIGIALIICIALAGIVWIRRRRSNG